MSSHDEISTSFLNIAHRNGIVFVTPTGPTIGERECNIIRDDVTRVVEPLGKAMTHLVLDMSNIEFMSSVGIGLCVDLHNLAAEYKADAIVVGANRSITDLFKLVQLDRTLTVVPDDNALQKLLDDQNGANGRNHRAA